MSKVVISKKFLNEAVIDEQLLNKAITIVYNCLQQNFKGGSKAVTEHEIGSKYWCQLNTRLKLIRAAINILEQIQELEDIRYKSIQFYKLLNHLEEILNQDLIGLEIHLKYSKNKNYYIEEA
jgi:hypothetical protein